MSEYRKIVYIERGEVVAQIHKGARLIHKKAIHDVDVGFFLFIFLSDSKRQEKKLQLAHKWADDHIPIYQKYETK